MTGEREWEKKHVRFGERTPELEVDDRPRKGREGKTKEERRGEEKDTLHFRARTRGNKFVGGELEINAAGHVVQQ